MDLKAHARYELEAARRMTEGVLAAFKTQSDWLYQSHPKANHALWITGHLGLVDNAFLSRFRPQRGHKPSGWEELFGRGSELQECSAYPPHHEVLAYLHDRRKTLMQVFDELTPEELSAPAPPAGERHPIAGAPCIGHLFLFAARHEAGHCGQLTVAHRGLGNAPILGQPVKSAK
jgi:hypothetical protein